MVTKEYQTNRARIPIEELCKFRGSWAAFSADGTRVVASAPTLTELEETLTKAAANGCRVVFEWVGGSEDDSLLGGGDL